MFARVRAAMDPFVTKVDDENNVRVTADAAEGVYSHIPWGDFADYCPVTLIDNGWLLQGKEDIELQV